MTAVKLHSTRVEVGFVLGSCFTPFGPVTLVDYLLSSLIKRRNAKLGQRFLYKPSLRLKLHGIANTHKIP